MKYEELSDFELIERTMAVMEHVDAIRGHCNCHGTASCDRCVFGHIDDCPLWYLVEIEFDKLADDEQIGEYFRNI